LTVSNFLGHKIAKVHKALKAQFQGLLSPHGVTVQQFEVMRNLKTDSGLTAAQLVEHIITDSSTMMSILKRLESKTLILRKPDENDRRTKLIYLTSKGQELMENLTVIAVRHNKHMNNCCSAKELQIFNHILSELYDFSQTDRKIYHKAKN